MHRPEGFSCRNGWTRCIFTSVVARGLSPGQIYATDDRYRSFLRLNCSYWNTEVQASLQELCRLAQTL